MDKVTTDIAAHNVNTEHGIQVGAGNGSSVLVGTDNSQTLTRKTLTSPIITSPTITGTIAVEPGNQTLTIGDSADTIAIPGNLVVTGTTTTANNLSTADHDIFIDIGTTASPVIDEDSLTTGSGILLGAETGYIGTTRHGLTFTRTGTTSGGDLFTQWTMSDDLRINGKLQMNTVNVITASGAWDGLTVGVAKGGTGKTSVATDSLLRGADTGTLVETTIGDGLKLAMNSLDVDPTEIGVEEFNNIPGTFGSAGNALVVDSAETGLEYSNTLVGASTFGDWARKDGGTVSVDISDPGASDTNRVLRYNSGTYAWVDAGDLNVGLSSTANVSVASVTTSVALTVKGNTTSR